MKPRQLLSFAYSWAVARISPDKLDEWLSELDAPYWTEQGSSRPTLDPEAEKEEFRRAMAAG